MEPFASELNKRIQESSPAVYDCLSDLGKRIFFPAGILSQSAEARAKQCRLNATIGTALKDNQPMRLEITEKFFDNLEPGEIYSYAPPAGRPKLRALWKKKLLKDNPSLQGKTISSPIVTSALTHGLSICADLLVDKDDAVIVPDKIWGNYKLIFAVGKEARLSSFPMFDEKGGFNVKAFGELLAAEGGKREKLVVILNFPNNPAGYTPSIDEARELTEIISVQAEKGNKIAIICDDAYFGLFFGEDSLRESMFAMLCDAHSNILAVKVCGATKENYAWGFRTGFITLGNKTSSPKKLYSALENKITGLIRSGISSCNHVSQSILEKILVDPEYEANMTANNKALERRAVRTRELVSQDKFKKYWSVYPSNSGYFLCLKLKGVEAEALRVHLLDKYKVGTIALEDSDLRIAFSGLEEESLEEMVGLIARAAEDLTEKS